MKSLPNMNNYPKLLKITFVDEDVWENVKFDGWYCARNYSYVPEDDQEDELYVTYRGAKLTLKASEIKTIESAKK
ncbi:hypothetical protein [Helicobacter suis]|uniref:hypothetical protein n=1 Tax=Helicobacter suis TaxID=104628 RepID=UPI0013D8D331|nr:hypothetical protein [Helicobacter suis]